MYRFLLGLGALFFACPLFAQAITPVVFLEKMVEERDSPRLATNNLLLVFSATGHGDDDDYTTRRRIDLAPVKDNMGAVHQPHHLFPNSYTSNANLEVRLAAPERAATQLQELRGELVVYEPTLENGGKVVITNPTNYYDQDLLGGKVPGLEVIQLSQKARLAEKEAERKKRIAKMEVRLDSLRATGERGETLVNLLISFNESAHNLGDIITKERPKLYLRVEGPAYRLVSVAIFDADGKSIEGVSYGNTYLLKRALADTDSIVLYVESPASITSYPFRIGPVMLH